MGSNQHADLALDETTRLRVVHDLHLGGVESPQPFDSLLRLACQQTGLPIAWLSLVDEQHVWLLATQGFGEQREWPRSAALCSVTIHASELLEANDCRDDPRFAASPMVRGPQGIRFYAGVPLRVEGQPVGVLALAAPVPHRLDDTARRTLIDLATLAEHLLSSHLRERRLRRQNARLRTASLSSSDWLWETNEHGRITWVSDSIEVHTGRPASADVGLTMPEINRRCDADTSHSWDNFLARRSSREPFKDLITERSTPKGVVVTSINGRPVFDSQGKFRGYRGTTTNITERLQAKNAARRAEQLLSDALESLAAGVMISDPTDRVLRSNAIWRASLRRFPTQGNWRDMVRQMVYAGEYPDAIGREEEFIAWRLGMVTDKGEQHEMRWRKRWVIVSARRLPDGNVVHLSVDITARKRAELALAQQRAQLRESEERLSAVIEAVPDLWFVLDANGHYLECSDDGHPMLTQHWYDIKGQPFATDLPASLADLALPAIARALDADEVQRIEYKLTTLDGVERSFEARISPMPGRRLLYVTRDLTEQRATEQVLRDKRALELASHAKSEFLSRMSHEMRTPLNAVIGFAQLLRLDPEHVEPDKLSSYADHVLNAGQHLLALINDVLDLQKVEEGGFTLEMQPVSLDDTVARTVELLTPMAQERRVTFDNHVSHGLWVRADAQRLRQVLINIVSNAIKYNREGGRVHVSTEAIGRNRIALTVEDTGAGMNAEQLGRLFQPFERLGYETSGVEGSGLGLIIARSLTQAIGGQLEVTSQPQRGTRVRIVLQREALPDAPEATDAEPPVELPTTDTAPRQPLRMMYVEDNRINAILFEEALRRHSGKVELRIAEDGDEALALVREWLPEVLVLDAHLPGLSGFEVLRELRKQPGLATTPAYMCSADAMPDDVQRAYEAGFIGYWTKPVDIASVLAEIDGLISRSPQTG